MDELDKLDSLLVYATFFIGTLFLTVVMLNILVAVISDTYARVEDASLSELYKVMSDIIVEAEYLIPEQALEDHDNCGDYLYVASIMGAGEEIEAQVQEVDGIRAALVNRNTEIEDYLNNCNEMIFASVKNT